METIKFKEEIRKEVWELYTQCEHELHNLKVYVDQQIAISKETFVGMRTVKNNLIKHIQEAYDLLKDEDNIIRNMDI